MKSLLSFFVAIVFTTHGFSQTVNMYFHNCVLVSNSEFQFDVSFENKSTDVLGFNSVVVRFTHNAGITTGGTIGWDYIAGSSNLPSPFPGNYQCNYTASNRLANMSTSNIIFNTLSAPLFPKDSVVKIGRFRFFVTGGTFTPGADLGLIWKSGPGCVLYVNGSNVTTSFNAAPNLILLAPCPLVIPPVEPVDGTIIADFTGKIDEKNDVLTWSTTKETKNSHFNLYHSANGVDYNFFAKVSSKAVGGNSNNPLGYGYVYSYPNYGMNYYRLEYVGLDGTASVFSKTVALERLIPKGKYSLYPNPVNNVVTLNIDAEHAASYVIKIMDVQGRRIKEVEAYCNEGVNKISIDLDGLAASVYQVVLYKDNTKVYEEQIGKGD